MEGGHDDVVPGSGVARDANCWVSERKAGYARADTQTRANRELDGDARCAGFLGRNLASTGSRLSHRERILPTKPKISRLITRGLIECRASRALQTGLFHLSSGPARPLALADLPPVRRHLATVSVSFLLPFRSVALSARRTRRLFLFRLAPSFFALPSSALIHIHAPVIVCRFAAGGHYYTSCARSRHRHHRLSRAPLFSRALLILSTLAPPPSCANFPTPALVRGCVFPLRSDRCLVNAP